MGGDSSYIGCKPTLQRFTSNGVCDPVVLLIHFFITVTCTKQWKKWTNQNWSHMNLETLTFLVTTLILLWATPISQIEATFIHSAVLEEISRPFLYVVANHSLFCSLHRQIIYYDCMPLLSNTGLSEYTSVFYTHTTLALQPRQYIPSTLLVFT